MKLYIELLVILAILGVVGFWLIWNRIASWRAIKKYKPENDKGRKTSEKGGKAEHIGIGEQPVEVPVSDNTGLDEPPRPELLQETDVSPVGETGNSNRKNGSGIRKLLGRRRKG